MLKRETPWRRRAAELAAKRRRGLERPEVFVRALLPALGLEVDRTTRVQLDLRAGDLGAVTVTRQLPRGAGAAAAEVVQQFGLKAVRDPQGLEGIEDRVRAMVPDILDQACAEVQRRANRGGSFARALRNAGPLHGSGGASGPEREERGGVQSCTDACATSCACGAPATTVDATSLCDAEPRHVPSRCSACVAAGLLSRSEVGALDGAPVAARPLSCWQRLRAAWKALCGASVPAGVPLEAFVAPRGSTVVLCSSLALKERQREELATFLEMESRRVGVRFVLFGGGLKLAVIVPVAQ